MKHHPSYFWFSLMAVVCLASAGCALPHPVTLLISPTDGAIIFLPAPGTSYPVKVNTTTSNTLLRGLSNSIQLTTDIADNGNAFYHVTSGGISALQVPWTPTSIGDHLLHFSFVYTYSGGHGEYDVTRRVCVVNNYLYSYPGLQAGAHDYCPNFIWAAFGQITSRDRALAVVAPRQLAPLASTTPIRLTPHVVQPFPTDTFTPSSTATLTPTPVYCPKGTMLIPSLGNGCYYVTRTPKPQGTVVAACFTYKNASACTTNGCSWDKGSSTCH